MNKHADKSKYCSELPPGTPCPTPENCTCFEETPAWDLSWLLWVAILAAVTFLFSIAALSADVERSCLTKSQARAKWPTKHLYWHGMDHCWDATSRKRRPKIKYRDPVFAQQVTTTKTDRLTKPKLVSPNEFNELDAQADSDAFFRAEPIPLWPPLLLPQPRFIPWEQRISGFGK